MNFRITVLIYYTLLFTILAFTALNVDYVEGDDASTVLFHLMNRNTEVQTPYSPYHSGADYLLSFLPSEEGFLISASVWSSFVFGYISICLIFIWISFFIDISKSAKIIIGLSIPFIIPELLFQSLLYNPTNIGLVFCLTALICLEQYVKNHNSIYLACIPVTMLIAIPFRWPLLFFFPTLFAFYLYRRDFSSFKIQRSDLLVVAALSLSALTSVLGIWISGYPPKTLIEVFLWGKDYMSESERSLSALFATSLSFLTPALIILIVVGVLTSKHSSLQRFLILFLGCTPFFILGFFPSLKYSISILPVLTLFAAVGIEWFLQQKIKSIFLLIIVLLPWTVGMKIHTNKFAYGPGFEIEQWDKSKIIKDVDSISKNPDSRLNDISPEFSFKAGFLMLTLEGPRPLYGYASCLFSGEWYDIIEDNAIEREVLLQEISEHHINILFQGRRHSFLQCILFREGFKSIMPFKYLNENFSYRDFYKGSRVLRIIIPNSSKEIKKSIDQLSSIEPKFGIYLSYSSEAQVLDGYSKLRRIGPYTLIKEN